MKRLQSLKKKDKGIALIFSLFFFVIFFAFGTALLFRSSLTKKTSNALTEAQVNNASLEGAIGAIRANLVMANLNNNSGGKSSGTSLTFEGKMNKSILDSSRSPVYTISSMSSESKNDATNNIVSKTTPELFQFNFNGIELTNGIDSSLAGAPKPEWSIHYSDSSKSAGSSAIRYSYLVIDQTGKVNPNYAGNSGDLGTHRTGFDTEIYKNAQSVLGTSTSGIFDLSGLFTNIQRTDLAVAPFTLNRFNNLTQIQDLMSDNNGSFQSADLDDFDEITGIGVFDENNSEIKMSSERLAQELLYPYTHPVTYKERSNVFNLAYLDSDAFKSLSDQDKVEIITGGNTPANGVIPYIAHMPSEEYDVSKPEQIVNQREVVTSNLIDFIDNDIIATNNYGFYTGGTDSLGNSLAGKPWSFDDWMSNTNNKPYCGFEGIYTTQISFQIRAYGHTNTSSKPLGNPLWWRSFIIIAPEVSCAYDLNGTPLADLVAKNPSYAGGRLMMYMRIKGSWQLAKETADPLEDPDGNGFDDDYKTYTDYPLEIVSAIPGVRKLGRYDYQTEYPAKKSGKHERDAYAYYKVGTPYENMHYPASLQGTQEKPASGSGNTYVGRWEDNWASLLHSSHPEDADDAIHHDETFSPRIHRVKLKFDSPLLIFLDLPDNSGNYNSKPDPGEIVNISSITMPTQATEDDYGYSHRDFAKIAPIGVVATTTGSNANRDVLTAVASGDPRLNFLPSTSYPLSDSWMYFYHSGSYQNNDFNKVHIYTDHLAKYDIVIPGAEDSDLRYPTKEELTFTFPKTDNEVVLPSTLVDTNERPVSGVPLLDLTQKSQDLNEYVPNRQVERDDNGNFVSDQAGFKSVSSFSMPLRFSTNSDGTFKEFNGFGGINQIADIGKISRGEHWRTFNICQYNIALLEDPTNSSKYIYAGVKDPSYTDSFDSSLTTAYTDGSGVTSQVPMKFPFYRTESSGNVDDLITDYSTDSTSVGRLLNGGDAAILDQLGFDESNKDDATITLPAKTIYGTFNPNTAYPLAFQSVISGIKINRKDISSKTYIKGFVDDDRNPALPLWKSSALASKFYKLITDNLNGSNKLAPFDRKYSFSKTLDKSPGDVGYQEGFNVSSTYDPVTRSYMNGDQRAGSMRWGNVFANKDNYFLSDSERELLYTNTRQFISIRYNYYSAIILVEPMKLVPSSASGERIVTINNSGDKAKIDSHYRVRAELAHDILTNQVKVLNYSILN